MTRSTNMEHVAHLQRMANESWIGSPERAALDAAIAVLSAQQPASDGGFTAADMMDARQEGRKEAQQPAGFSAADMADAAAQGFRDGVASVGATAAKDAEIERLRAEREVIGAEAVKYAGKSGRLEAKVERLAEALRDIESRPWNGVRPIQIAARAALRDHDQEGGDD